MDHIGVVVDDLDGAISFFEQIGLEAGGKSEVAGEWVDRVVGLDSIAVDVAMVRTPDGNGCLELIRFNSPEAEGEVGAQANARGLRHVAFVIDDLDSTLERIGASGHELIGEVESYSDVFRLCYVRGPGGIIIELAERIGGS